MLTRRQWCSRVGGGLVAAAGLGLGYGFWEAAHVRIDRHTVAVPNLPPAFAGKRVAVIADIHHGPFVDIDYVHDVVRLTNTLQPDLVALVGDYAHKGHHAHVQLPACLEALSALTAPLGVFAVPGNHDIPDRGKLYHRLLAATPITDLLNCHRRLTIGGDSLYLAGVDDLWWGRPDKDHALRGVPAGAAVVLLSHNPDYAEDAPDDRIGLVLSGHTHGGQIYLGSLGQRWIPSKYGLKYRQGLVRGPKSQVFISRGLGEAGVPLRYNCPPEINLLTLTA